MFEHSGQPLTNWLLWTQVPTKGFPSAIIVGTHRKETFWVVVFVVGVLEMYFRQMSLKLLQQVSNGSFALMAQMWLSKKFSSFWQRDVLTTRRFDDATFWRRLQRLRRFVNATFRRKRSKQRRPEKFKIPKMTFVTVGVATQSCLLAPEKEIKLEGLSWTWCASVCVCGRESTRERERERARDRVR